MKCANKQAVAEDALGGWGSAELMTVFAQRGPEAISQVPLAPGTLECV